MFYISFQAAIKDPKLTQRKLELYPGYIATIKQQERDIMLNVEISHKVNIVSTKVAIFFIYPTVKRLEKYY